MPANLTAVDNQLAQYTNGDAWTGLGAWANYIQQQLIPLCDGAPINSVECFGTQNREFQIHRFAQARRRTKDMANAMPLLNRDILRRCDE